MEEEGGVPLGEEGEVVGGEWGTEEGRGGGHRAHALISQTEILHTCNTLMSMDKQPLVTSTWRLASCSVARMVTAQAACATSEACSRVGREVRDGFRDGGWWVGMKVGMAGRAQGWAAR